MTQNWDNNKRQTRKLYNPDYLKFTLKIVSAYATQFSA